MVTLPTMGLQMRKQARQKRGPQQDLKMMHKQRREKKNSMQTCCGVLLARIQMATCTEHSTQWSLAACACESLIGNVFVYRVETRGNLQLGEQSI